MDQNKRRHRARLLVLSILSVLMVSVLITWMLTLRAPDAASFDKAPTTTLGNMAASRQLTATLTGNSLELEIDTLLPADDPDAAAILSGRLAPATFVAHIFGILAIGEQDVVSAFARAPAQYIASPDALNVRLTSGDLLPARPIMREISMQRDRSNFLEGSRDRYELIVRDYTITTVAPVPARLAGSDAVWMGAPPKTAIDVGLDFSGPGYLQHVFRYAPFEFLPTRLWPVLSLLSAILLALPLAWWWMLRTGDGGAKTSVLEGDLRPLCGIVLLTWIAVPFVDFVNQTALDVDVARGPSNFFHRTEPTDLALVAVGAAVIAFGIWLFRKTHRFLRALQALTLGILLASLFDLGTVTAGLVLESLPETFLPAGVALLGALVLTVLVGLPVWVFVSLLQPATWGWILAVPLAALALFALDYPSLQVASLKYFGGPGGVVVFMFLALQQLAPFAGLVVPLLWMEKVTVNHRVLLRRIAFVMFTTYLVGTTSSIWFVPIPFLLSLFLAPFVLYHEGEVKPLEDAAPTVRADWRHWIQVALESLYVQSFGRGVDALAKKVSTGDLPPADFETQRTALDDYVRVQNQRALVCGKVRARDAVLAIGPHETNWENGAHAAHLGLWLALVWFAFFLFITLSKYAPAADAPFGSIVVLRAVLVGVLPWLISGFFFGYFFTWIRGRSGFEKGLRIGLVVAACQAVTWVVGFNDIAEAATTIVRGAVTVLFFVVLGTVVFDWATFKKQLDGAAWSGFWRFREMRTLATAGTALVAGLAATIGTYLSGQFPTLVSLLLRFAQIGPPAAPTGSS